MGAKDAVKSFLGGLVLTLVLVVVVPVLVNNYAAGYFEELIGDRTFLILSSDVIVNILVWVLVIGFMLVLGAGGILKRFGIVGILGLVVAYWALGDITDAVVPLATLAIVLVIAKTIEIKRRKRTEGRKS